MTGTLRNQLVTYGMEDRLPEVLEEAVRVRAEMGYPIMATPFSQLVGIQALLNVVQGERYLDHPRREPDVPRRPLRAAPGRRSIRTCSTAPLDRTRARHGRRRGPRSPSLAEIRREYGKHVSDEELLLRYLIPGPDVDAMYAAARPIEPVYPLGDGSGLGWLRDVLASSSARALTASRGGVSISLRR